MIKSPFLLLLSFLISGCFIANTPGFYSGYKNIQPDRKQNIIFVEDSLEICHLKNDQKIYSITAAQLLKCLQNNDSSIVYFWSPNCSSKSCILLDAAQNHCDRKRYTLYVITEYYDMEKTEPQNTAGLSLFSINHQYYKTDYCNKYVKRFTAELTKNGAPDKGESYYRYCLFYKDKFVRRKENLLEN